MSYSVPKVHGSSNELPSLLTGAKNYSPNAGNMMYANQAGMPSQRNVSPSMQGYYPGLELNAPRSPASLNYYGSKLDLDQGMPSSNSLLNPGSQNGYKLDFEITPRRPQDLLALQTYNTLSNRINKAKLARDDLERERLLLSQLELEKEKERERERLSQSANAALQQNASPVVEKDSIPDSINQGHPNPGAQAYYTPQTYLQGPRNRLEEGPDMLQGGPVVHNFFNRQSQLMMRMFQDFEQVKKMEYMRQRMWLDQQFGIKNTSLDLMMNPIQYVPVQYVQPQIPIATSPIILMQAPPNVIPATIQYPYVGEPKKSSSRTPSAAEKGRPYPPDKMDSPPIKSGKKGPVKKSNGNRANARSNIRKIGWTMALPGLWFISMAKWAEKRRSSELKILEDSIPEHLEKFLEFAGSVIEKEIKALATDKNPLILVPPSGTTIKSGDLGKRCKAITDHLVTILDSLSLQLDSGKLPIEFFQFLSRLSEDDSVLPDNFLSGFELDRLSFNMLGNLTAMNEMRSKMILGAFIIIKGILYFIIMRSWTVVSSIPEKNVNMKNMINVGSAFYHIVLDVLRETVPETKGDKEPPFQAAPPTFAAVDPAFLNKLGVVPDNNDDDEQEVVSGFYNRDRLKDYLDGKPAMVKEVKEAVLDFLDVLYELTHSVYEPKAHVKKMFGQYRRK